MALSPALAPRRGLEPLWEPAPNLSQAQALRQDWDPPRERAPRPADRPQEPEPQQGAERRQGPASRHRQLSILRLALAPRGALGPLCWPVRRLWRTTRSSGSDGA